MQLIEHRYSDKPARYYINSRRVSRDTYELAIVTARIKGQQHSCFMTKCKEASNGRFHRVNYSTLGGAV
ncbi:hypothetical protein [Novosphingobium sp. FKTRR1]|uniref:hypothetical protein n=1 Tax=Novosphingobium sp. FKTRR1 TaxID=2879118 RepID=UPI001CEFFC6F|nr:hypothetical protein [Novosphingobium sp. FKTRR1]